jgi:hypothetical protein
LGGDEELLTATVIRFLEQGQQLLIVCGSGFEVEDGRLEGKAESLADVNGFRGCELPHISS